MTCVGFFSEECDGKLYCFSLYASNDFVEFLAYKVFAEMLQWEIVLFTDALESVDLSLSLYSYGSKSKGSWLSS